MDEPAVSSSVAPPGTSVSPEPSPTKLVAVTIPANVALPLVLPIVTAAPTTNSVAVTIPQLILPFSYTVAAVPTTKPVLELVWPVTVIPEALVSKILESS